LVGGRQGGSQHDNHRRDDLWDESAAIYEHSLKPWERLSEELDCDVLFSQGGALDLAHSL
jgi:sarcosine oxidase subunit beta